VVSWSAADADSSARKAARWQIRINVASPGVIKTAGLDVFMDEEIKKGTVGETDEIGKTAVFLASDDSSFITGIELFVDGGAAQI
jgi:NAD(P)-dependent dehydrogenase (short-subunit alcohol dehydrogenase family)